MDSALRVSGDTGNPTLMRMASALLEAAFADFLSIQSTWDSDRLNALTISVKFICRREKAEGRRALTRDDLGSFLFGFAAKSFIDKVPSGSKPKGGLDLPHAVLGPVPNSTFLNARQCLQ